MPTFLNIAGLCINIIGSLLIFLNSPVVNFNNYIYCDNEIKNLNRKAKRKNNLSRLGMLLLVVGFVLQLTAIL